MSVYPSLEDMKVDHMMQVFSLISNLSKAQIYQKKLFLYSPLFILSETQAQEQAASNGMPTPHSASYPSAPSATSSASAVSNTGSYPGLAEYMGLELTEAEVRANMPEYLPAVVQVLNICEAIFCLTLAPNRAAALPLFLELALLHLYLA